MDAATRRAVLRAQRNEITEHHIYEHLAKHVDGKNRRTLRRIAKDERAHYDFWRKLTKEDVQPRFVQRWWYLLLAHVFGLVFALRLMERGEDLAQDAYERIRHVPGAERIRKDEEEHEQALIGILEDERLDYAGSIVLGLNDALVELTGALAGLTFALQDGRVVAAAGFITGFAASLSMAASEYLQSVEDREYNHEKHPLRAATYTGIAYIATVLVLIAPYFLLSNVFVALGTTLALAVLIVLTYTFYISTAKRQPFWPRFLRMAGISLGVAFISFIVGTVVRVVFGVGA